MNKSISSEYEKMDERIEIRLTNSEKNKIRKYATKSNHKTLSSYTRDRLLHPVIFVENPEPYSKVSYELNRIGTNINQIARHVNTHDEITKNDMDDLKISVKKMKREINKLRTELDQKPVNASSAYSPVFQLISKYHFQIVRF